MTSLSVTNQSENVLGYKIKPEYEKGVQTTPLQKKRITSVIAGVLCLVASIFSLIFVTSHGLHFLGFSILLSIGAFYAFSWAGNSVDLDKPEQRRKVIEILKTKKFWEIKEQYPNEAVIRGYALLGPKESVYAIYRGSLERYKRKDQWRTKEKNNIETEFFKDISTSKRELLLAKQNKKPKHEILQAQKKLDEYQRIYSLKKEENLEKVKKSFDNFAEKLQTEFEKVRN